MLFSVCLSIFTYWRYPTKILVKLPEEQIQQMEILEDGTFRTTGNDAYIVIPGISRMVLSIEVKVEKFETPGGVPMDLQIYYDTGQGYSEVETQLTRMNPGKNYLECGIDAPVESIRLDFARQEGCTVKIAQVTVNPHSVLLQAAAALVSALMTMAAMLVLPTVGGGIYGIVYSLFTTGIANLYGTADYSIIAVCFFALTLLFAHLARKAVKAGGRGPAHRALAAVLLLSAFALYTYLAIKLPYGSGPDESMRYSIVQFIARHGTLPHGADPEVRNEIWGFSYAFYPILPYIIAGYITRALRMVTEDFRILLIAARMVSVLSTTVTVWFMLRIGDRLFEGVMRYALAFAAAFFPSLVFISSYVSTESFSVMATAIIVYYWLKGMDSGWKLPDCTGLCIGMALCLLSYYNAYGIILASVPFFFLTIAGSGQGGKKIAGKTVYVVLLTTALAGWWFVRNGILYNGDIFGRRSLNECQELYASEAVRQMVASAPRNLGLSLREMLFGLKYIVRTGKSFFGAMAATGILSTEYLCIPYAGLFGLAAVGNLVLIARFFFGSKKTDRKNRASFYLASVFSALFPAGLAVWFSYVSDFEPQGRYWLPGIVPLLVLVSMGINSFGVRKRGEETAGWSYSGALAVLTAVYLVMVLYVFLY